MISSAHKHLGKTTLACRIIHTYCKLFPIAAVKTTSSLPSESNSEHELYSTELLYQAAGVGYVWKNTHKPKVLAFSQTNRLNQDNQEEKTPDTYRFLDAGAQAAYLILADQGKLGMLMQEVEKDISVSFRNMHTPVIYESHAARQICIPGLLLLLDDNKPHAARKEYAFLKSHADIVIETTGRGAPLEDCLAQFDFDGIRWLKKNFVY